MNHLKDVKIKDENKNKNSKECEKTMLQFFYSQNNIFKFVSKYFSIYELALFIKSRLTYIAKKNYINKTMYSKREIVFVELGANIGNELSYEHFCVVLESYKDKIFVVPCSSSKITKVYDKQSNLLKEYIIGKKDIDGFTKDTVLILNEAKWINKSRVLMFTKKKISQELYKEMYEKTFLLIFPSKEIQIKNLEKIIKEQKDKIFELEEKIEVFEKGKNLEIENKNNE